MDAIFSPDTSTDSNTAPITGRDSLHSLRLAISDPGSFLARGDHYQEPLLDWQVRAVLLAIGSMAPVATTEFECPMCNTWAPWTHGDRVADGWSANRLWCQSCGANSSLSTCQTRGDR